MTQEEKRLLLKDLCARSYYQPFVQLNPGAYNKPEKCWICGVSGEDIYLNVDSDPFSLHDFNILPYLRPMSSMTEEEREEFRTLILPEASCAYEDCLEWDAQVIGGGYLQISVDDFSKVVDWLNVHYFDYRGLIKKGLALEAPEGMYE